MSRFLIGCLLVSATLLSLGTCHDGYSGKCPKFTAMETFDWGKFSGRWYAVEKFDTDSRCLTYDFKEDEYGNRIVLQVSEQDTLKKLSIDNKVKYRGKLSFPRSNQESEMLVEFPIGGLLFDSASYKVLDTDYDNYGVLCSCQEIPFFFGVFTYHRRSCTALQRTPQLNKEYTSKIHDVVNQQIGDRDAAHDFDAIRHDSCDYEDNGKGLQIDVDKIWQTTKDEASLSVKGTVEQIEDAIKEIIYVDEERGFGGEFEEDLDDNLQP